MARKSDEAGDELDSLSPYPDYSPPLYSAEDEEDTLAGPSDPLVPQTFKLGTGPEEACVAQKWEPGFVYGGHGIFTDEKTPYLIGTTNARYSEDEDNLYQLMTQQAARAPRIALTIRGTHTHDRQSRDDSSKTWPDRESPDEVMIQQAAHAPRTGLTVEGSHEIDGEQSDDSPHRKVDFDLKVDISPCFGQTVNGLLLGGRTRK